MEDVRSAADAQLLDSNFEAAFRMMTSPQAREAFDLTKEPDAVRERYGRNRFGQCCLLARRLIERGVRFVTVNTFLTVFDEITWDIHGSDPFTSIDGRKNEVGPKYDQAYTRACSKTWPARACWKTRWSCTCGEFGRTPKINPAGGRDHQPACWTVLFAGGPIQGGRVVGSSNEIGYAPGPPRLDRRDRRDRLSRTRPPTHHRIARPSKPPDPDRRLRRRADRGTVLTEDRVMKSKVAQHRIGRRVLCLRPRIARLQLAG